MAVAAAYFAFGDLNLNRGPREALPKHVRHIFALIAQMVELEHDGIGLAAFHAGMLAEVIPCAILMLSRAALVVLTNAFQLMVPISDVPITFVLGHAVATPRLPFASVSVSDAEFVIQLPQTASATAPLIGREFVDQVRKRRLPDRDPYECLLSIVDTEFARGLS